MSSRHRLREPGGSFVLPGWCLALLAAAASGCTATPDPTRLAMHDARATARLDWNDLVERSLDAEVIVIGEEHDDATAHALQAALVADLLALDPRTAVSLEMFERDEQEDVDAWLAGDLPTADLLERTGSGSWYDWNSFYQPVIDAAKAVGAPIVAANAPRTYVRRARIEGYEALRSLPPEERALFDLPETLDQGGYWERFRDTMRDLRGDEVDEEAIRRTFSSQMVWDATMAASIASALDRGDVDRVVHLVGRFHGDFEGGTIRELRRLRPGVRTLVVSCVSEGEGRRLEDEDVERADVVVYTGG
ncbi:MAG: ChaN family lipoprotein [Planctomycetota bacterium]|nr:ChaN family lipoprotein [Planctomycetota bacterium]